MKKTSRVIVPAVSALLCLPMMGCASRAVAPVGCPPVSQSIQDVPPGVPAAKPLDLAGLQVMLTQMGYNPVETDDKTGLIADVDGDNLTFSAVFSPLPDTLMLLVTTNLVTYTPAELKKVNSIALLEQSGADDLYFSLVNKSDGETLYGNDEIPLSGLTALSLREDLSGWAGDIDNSRNIWDPRAWK